MTNKYNSPARIRGNLPPSIQVAHKTGTGSYDNIINACNDVGIITLPNQHKIILSVFVKDANEGFNVTEQLIANIAQLVYESYMPKPTYSRLINIGNNEAAGNWISLNGVKHYYETYGKGAPILLIHGNSTPTRGWAPQIEYFSSYYKVYSIDCRGRGKSELGNDSLTYLQQAEDLSLFLEKLQLDSVCIIGKSDGAIIGLLMAIHHPERLKKLVAFSGNLQPDTSALYPKTLDEIKQAREVADAKLAVNDSTKNWKIEQQRNRMMEFQPNITAQDLQKIAIPVLVVSGDRDVIKVEHSLFIYQNLKKGNLCILPNQQHGLPRLNPTLFNTTVKNYLETEFKSDSFRFE
jgi:pimeloyl-ACP methyl ester carboxylesterase